jgi:type IV secretion system protein VirB1
LHAGGWNYSVGLGQINVANFARLGLTPGSALEPCTSLAAMQSVLGECYARAASNHAAQNALRFALSCYYSGNFTTGLRHGYVGRVVRASAPASAAGSALPNRKERS